MKPKVKIPNSMKNLKQQLQAKRLLLNQKSSDHYEIENTTNKDSDRQIVYSTLNQESSNKNNTSLLKIESTQRIEETTLSSGTESDQQYSKYSRTRIGARSRQNDKLNGARKENEILKIASAISMLD